MPPIEHYGIEWARRPTNEEMEHQWRITRPPAKSPMRLLILSHDITGCYTHFVHGRTRPHTSSNCEGCQNNRLPEWHGYLACLQSTNGLKWILEVTKGCAKALDEEFRTHRTLRGAIIEAGRTSSKVNGRQYVRVLSHAEQMDTLQKAPNLQPFLARMWQQRDQPLFNHEGVNDPIKIAEATSEPSATENREAS